MKKAQSLHAETWRAGPPGELVSRCEACRGLCCVALYFEKSEGFPDSKPAGRPCRYLTDAYRCEVHAQWAARGLKGCRAFDCYGAGQKAVGHTFAGEDWKTSPGRAQQMFSAFLVLCRLHQMLWYLSECEALLPARECREEARAKKDAIGRLTFLPAPELLALDLKKLRDEVDPVLRRAGELCRAAVGGGCAAGKEAAGRDFRGACLDGADFRGGLLLAANLSGCGLRGANFLGADLRDADVSGADLSDSIFLTQGQVYAMKGDGKTALPGALLRPSWWGGR